EAVYGEGVVVVVADEHRLAPRPCRLRAGADIGWRAIEAQEARGEIAAAGKLAKLLIEAQQFGHMRPNGATAGEIGRAFLDALAQIPASVGGPQALEPACPGGPRAV